MGVKFAQLRQVFDKAALGCTHCKLLQTSFEVVQPDKAQQALLSSGIWSSTDSKIICEYLPDSCYKIKFNFECPDYKLSIELYGILGNLHLVSSEDQ